jgi:hypothetical protein
MQNSTMTKNEIIFYIGIAIATLITSSDLDHLAQHGQLYGLSEDEIAIVEGKA